jgi:hypothetical protein
LTYASSLLFWLVPAFLLWPRVARLTDKGGRRRRAMAVTILEIVVLGIVLDFILGRWVLSFDQREPTPYLLWLDVPWLQAHVPLEELLFYALAPVAMLLVYVWCDEYWMAAYNPVQLRAERARRNVHAVRLSSGPVVVGVASEILGLWIWTLHGSPGSLPVYYTFLAVAAFAPAAFLFERVSDLVNWRAFGITLLYVVLTSILWEPVLALPRAWWWYQPTAMIGIWIAPLSLVNERPLPIEAAIVWIYASFTCVLSYEAVKSWTYRLRPNKPVFRGVSAAGRTRNVD